MSLYLLFNSDLWQNSDCQPWRDCLQGECTAVMLLFNCVSTGFPGPVQVMKTCKDMGIKSVAIYSDADSQAVSPSSISCMLAWLTDSSCFAAARAYGRWGSESGSSCGHWELPQHACDSGGSREHWSRGSEFNSLPCSEWKYVVLLTTVFIIITALPHYSISRTNSRI